jgi:hypothetical protein
MSKADSPHTTSPSARSARARSAANRASAKSATSRSKPKRSGRSKPKKTIQRLESIFNVSRLGEAQTKEKFERLGTLRRIVCVNTSMEPSISRGDIVFVDTLKTHADCGIFAIKNNRGEETLVRLEWVPSGACFLVNSRGVERVAIAKFDGNGRRFRVFCDNPIYSDWDIVPESDIEIIGQYVCRMTQTLGLAEPVRVRC